MKLNFVLIMCLYLLVGLSLIPASHAQTKTPPSGNPQPILITMEAVDVHPSVIEKLDKSIPDGPKKAALILDALITDHVNEAVIMSIQTPNDFSGAATYYKVIGFTSQDKASPGKAFVTLETSINVTPHLEGNEIVSVKLKTMVTQVSSQGVPYTVGYGRTLPKYYLKNGETAMLRGQPLDPNGQLAKTIDLQTLEKVTFITANILPIQDASKQTP